MLYVKRERRWLLSNLVRLSVKLVGPAWDEYCIECSSFDLKFA